MTSFWLSVAAMWRKIYCNGFPSRERERDVGGKGQLCVLYDPLGGRTDQDSTNSTLTLHQHIVPPHLFLATSPHHFIPTCLHFFPVFSRRCVIATASAFPILLASSKNPHRRLDVHTHNKWLYSVWGGTGSQAFSRVNLLIRPHVSPSHTSTHLNMT